MSGQAETFVNQTGAPEAPAPGSYLGTVARVEIETTVRQNDPPKDFVVNTLWFQSGSSTLGQSEWQQLTDGLSTIWKTQGAGSTWGPFGGCGHTIKAYDLADPKPRPVKAHTTYVPSFWSNGDLAPRQLACVLSFYGDRNIKRQRSHIWIGPFDASLAAHERIPNSLMQTVLDLGNHFLDKPIGVDWIHGFWSPAGQQFQVAAHYWVNDVWDTIRKRSPAETARLRLP